MRHEGGGGMLLRLGYDLTHQHEAVKRERDKLGFLM